jgi:hypothetical protein
MSDDVTKSVIETIDHVMRLHEKIKTLTGQLESSLEVASSLAGPDGSHIDYGVFYDLANLLREAEVPGRGVFTGNRQMDPPPGTVLRRGRHERTPAWPSRSPCVYVLLNGTEVIYVGKSKSIGSRIAAHSAKPWTVAEVIICESEEDATSLEGDLIFQHQPPLNRAGRWERPGTSGGSSGPADEPQVSPTTYEFIEEWQAWRFDGEPAPLPHPVELQKSLEGWIFRGKLSIADIIDLIPASLDRQGVAVEDRWRYFCGVAWRHIKQRDGLA